MEQVRPAVDADMRLIRATWAHSHMSRLPGRMRKGTWPIWDQIDGILRRTNLRVMVLPGGIDTIHAWAVANPGKVLHYAYVPKDLRGHGLGRTVITAAFGSYPEVIPLSYPYRLDKGASPRFVHQRPPMAGPTEGALPWKSRISTK